MMSISLSIGPKCPTYGKVITESRQEWVTIPIDEPVVSPTRLNAIALSVDLTRSLFLCKIIFCNGRLLFRNAEMVGPPTPSLTSSLEVHQSIEPV